MIDIQIRLVKVNESLNSGQYFAADVFTHEEIIVKLSGKQRMNFLQLPIGRIVYVEIWGSNLNQAHFKLTWKTGMGMEHVQLTKNHRKAELDQKFIQAFGIESFRKILVIGETGNLSSMNDLHGKK